MYILVYVCICIDSCERQRPRDGREQRDRRVTPGPRRGATRRDRTSVPHACGGRRAEKACVVYYGRMSHCSGDVGDGVGGGGTIKPAATTTIVAAASVVGRPRHTRGPGSSRFSPSGTTVPNADGPCCVTDGERAARRAPKEPVRRRRRGIPYFSGTEETTFDEAS